MDSEQGRVFCNDCGVGLDPGSGEESFGGRRCWPCCDHTPADQWRCREGEAVVGGRVVRIVASGTKVVGWLPFNARGVRRAVTARMFLEQLDPDADPA